MKYIRIFALVLSVIASVFLSSDNVSAAGMYTKLIASPTLKSSALDMVVSGNYAYVIEGNVSDITAGYLDVFDISDPANPTKKALITNTNFSGGTWGALGASISVSGNKMYAVWSNSDKTLMSVYDISNPANPLLLGELNGVTPSANSIGIYGSYAYIATLNGLNIVNISNPASMSITKVISNTGDKAVTISGGYLYTQRDILTPSYVSEFAVYNLSSPASPTFLGSVAIDSAITGIAIAGNYAYIGSSATGNEFDIVDITNKSTPIKLGGHRDGLGNALHWLGVEGQYVYAPYDGGKYNIFDVSNPSAPIIAGTAAISGYGIRAIPHLGKYVLIASGWGGGGGGGYLNVFTEPAPTLNFSVKDSVSGASSAALSLPSSSGVAYFDWSTSGAGNCTASNAWSGSRAISGNNYSQSVSNSSSSSTTFTYTLTCWNFVGTLSTSKNVSVTVPPEQKPDLGIGGINSVGTLTKGSSYTFSGMLNNQGLSGMNTGNSYRLTALGSAVTLPGSQRDIWQSGNYVYIVGYSPSISPVGGHLEIYDVSNPAIPIKTGGYYTGSGSDGWNGIALSGGYAYIGTNSLKSVKVISVSNPSNPTLVTEVSGGSTIRDVTLVGNSLYAVSDDELIIYNVSNPASSVKIGSVATNDKSTGVAVSGNYAYVVSGRGIPPSPSTSDSLQVFNISNPGAIVSVGSATIGNTYNFETAHRIKIQGNYAYITTSSPESGNGDVEVFDISNPANPSKVNGLILPAATGGDRDVSLSGNIAYIARSNAIFPLNIANPASMSVLNQTNLVSQAGNIFASQAHVYTAGSNNGSTLQIFEPHAFVRICVDNPNCLTSTTGMVGSVDIDKGVLGIGSSVAVSSASWTADLPVGTHTVYFCADPKDVSGYDGVSESNESNNCVSRTFNIVDSFTCSPSAACDGTPLGSFDANVWKEDHCVSESCWDNCGNLLTTGAKECASGGWHEVTP